MKHLKHAQKLNGQLTGLLGEYQEKPQFALSLLHRARNV